MGYRFKKGEKLTSEACKVLREDLQRGKQFLQVIREELTPECLRKIKAYMRALERTKKFASCTLCRTKNGLQKWFYYLKTHQHTGTFQEFQQIYKVHSHVADHISAFCHFQESPKEKKSKPIAVVGPTPFTEDSVVIYLRQYEQQIREKVKKELADKIVELLCSI